MTLTGHFAKRLALYPNPRVQLIRKGSPYRLRDRLFIGLIRRAGSRRLSGARGSCDALMAGYWTCQYTDKCTEAAMEAFPLPLPVTRQAANVVHRTRKAQS